MIIQIEKSANEGLYFLRVFEGLEMNNQTFIMSAYDTRENLIKEFEYWVDRKITA